MRIFAALFMFSIFISPDLPKAVSQNAPSDHKNDSATKKPSVVTPHALSVKDAGRNPTTDDHQQCCQCPTNCPVPKVEITPNPLVVAPQPVDPWIKWYVILTALIMIFSGFAAWFSGIQARATQQKERAWLVAIMEDVPDSLTQPPSSAVTKLVTNIYRLACKIENKGNSPAWLTERAAQMKVVPAKDDWLQELPETPDYGEITKLGEFGVTMPPNAVLPLIFYLSPSDAAAVEVGSSALYVYGFVKYRDAFRKRRETRFCFRLKIALGLIDPASRGFYIAGPRKYNKAT
jgi:hypothetical protein